MKTSFFALMCLFALAYMLLYRRKPSVRHHSIDVILPAYNEEICLTASIDNLLANLYVDRVICVNDGSTDGTSRVLAESKAKWGERLIGIEQENTGKGGALMHGLRYARTSQVFLTDADTYIAEHPAGRLDELLPWNWQPRQALRAA